MVDGEIALSEFIEAAESVVALFGRLCMPLSFGNLQANPRDADLLGSTAFTPVQKDMTGNIKV